MIRVSMGQHHMRNDRLSAEMFPDVFDERFAEVKVSAVDNYQFYVRDASP